MKLNHKAILSSEESDNVLMMQNKMKTLLDTENMDQSEKAAKYRDLLTRLRNYMKEIDVAPTVRVLPYSEPTIAPTYKIGKTPIVFKNVATNAAKELVLSGEIIPGTNYEDVYNYVFMKRKNKPQGVEQFLTHVESVGDDRLAGKIKNIASLPSTLRPEMITPSTPSYVLKNEGKEATPDNFSTPTGPANLATPVLPSKKAALRQRVQRGKGEKRLYIKLWKL